MRHRASCRRPGLSWTALAFLVAAGLLGCSSGTEEPAGRLDASFTFSPASPVVGQTVRFTDTSTGSPASWSWSFGDGSTGTSQNPSHVFSAAGAYTVALTASRGNASDNASRTVNVGQGSGLLPPDRTIDWSKAGVWHNPANPARPMQGTKGIPEFPIGLTINTTTPGHPYYCDPTGATDCLANLQAAINSCPEGSAVFMPAGTYAMGPGLNMRTRVVLRGAGAGATKLTMLGTGSVRSILFHGSGGTAEGIVMDPGPGPDPDNISGPLVSGYEKGSSTVVVSAALAANLSVGGLVLINQRNDPEFVTNDGSGGTLTWGAGGGLRALGETKMVSAISGTSITFNQPLFYTYESQFAPKLIRLVSSPLLNAGLEDLTIDGNLDGGYGGGRLIDAMNAAYCWIRRVEFTDWALHAIRFYWGSLGCEVTRCYMHDVGQFGGDQGYQCNLAGNATDCLIYDNISKWVHIGICVGGASATGNVIAYNYNHSTNHHQPAWSIPSHGSHGAHTYMNLFEGNVTIRQGADSYWGSGSHLVMFRNWHRLETNNPTVTRDMIAIDIEAWNQYYSAIGNILGHEGMWGDYEIKGPENGVYDTGDGRAFCWKVGFPNDGDQAGPRDAATVNSLIRHGNYDYVNHAVADWVAGMSQDLPASLYLDARPSWFGSLDWPPFGPDVPGYVRTTPAKQRWDAYAGSGRLSDLF
jgi:PKD repeat protein